MRRAIGNARADHREDARPASRPGEVHAMKRAWEDDGGPCPPWQEDC